MRIAFVWDWPPEWYQAYTWKDGLAAALKELINRGHDIVVMCAGNEDSIVRHAYFDIHVVSDIPEFMQSNGKFDVILHWADCTRPNARPLRELGIPMALCFAGGEPMGETLPFFDHVFVESKVYEEIYKQNDISVSVAFGTNTELYKPIEQSKSFDTIFPATFAQWKRHDLYAAATQGLRSLAVGYMYDDHEQECWQECVRLGTTILPHVSAETLHYLYAASKVCVIPSLSSGGSQRTVLEAMAMNLPVVITDSDKFDFARGHGVFEAEPNPQDIRSIINMALESEVSTRDYILENWSESSYADALEKGLLGICA